MNKDKHILPDTEDVFSRRIKREAMRKEQNISRKIIYGPDNAPLVNVEVSRELTDSER
jgi:hypothetical protein